MSFVMSVFKYYPHKTERRSIGGLFVGMLYDFGLLWIIQRTLLIHFLQTSCDSVIDAPANYLEKLGDAVSDSFSSVKEAAKVCDRIFNSSFPVPPTRKI